MYSAIVIVFCTLGAEATSWTPRKLDVEDVASRALATILLAHSPTLARVRASDSPLMSDNARISRRAAVLAPAISAPAVLWPLSASADAFTGKYTDPQHPRCTRNVKVKGSDVTITGFDQVDGSLWTVFGTATDKGMVLDFTPKGGPKGVTAEWTGNGFKFPDGNLWSKLPGKTIVASNKWVDHLWDEKLPGSEYKFVLRDGQAYLEASDGIGPEFKWKAKGAVLGNEIYLNLSEKGEKEIVTGKLTQKGAEFSNGMFWSYQGIR